MDELNQAPVEAPIDAPTEPTIPESAQNPDGSINGAVLYKLLVDGQEEEVDIETLKKGYAHNKAAAARMTEAQKLKSDTQRLLDILRDDPIAVRKQLDKDFDEKSFVSKRLAALMEDEMMTPEEKQSRQDALELKEYRERKAKEEEERRNLDLKATMDVEIGNLDKEFAEAFETVGLPKTNEARRRLASAMLDAVENNQNISTLELAKQVKKEMRDDIVELLKSSDDEAFEELLGSDLLTKAQKLSLKKLKTPGNRQEPRKVEDRAPKEEKARKKPADFLNDLGIF